MEFAPPSKWSIHPGLQIKFDSSEGDMRTWILAFCCSVGGVAAGLLLAQWIPAQGEPMQHFAVSGGQPVVAASAAGNECEKLAGLSATIRADMRAELAPFIEMLQQNIADSSEPGAARHGDDADLPETPNPAFDRASSVVQNAESYSQWTDRDADLLRAEMNRLSAKERTEILRRLAVAINQGRITPETERIPY